MTGENIEDLFIIASKLLYNNFKDKIAQMVSTNNYEFICLTFSFFESYRKTRPWKREKIKNWRNKPKEAQLNTKKSKQQRKEDALAEHLKPN